MNALASQDGQMLRARLEQARESLQGLVRELRAVDAELEGLATERQVHLLLKDACAAVEGLEAIGAADRFWGDRVGTEEGGHRIRQARGRVDAFQKRVSEIEDRREALVEEIGQAEERVDFLEDDVFEIQQQEERRRQEWIVEREISALPGRAAVMPWTRGGEDDDRFRKSLATSLLASLLLGLVLPQIPLPLPEPWEAIEVPERFARLIREERRLPPPPPAREQPKPEERPPEPVDERPLVAQEPTPTPSPQPAAKPSPESKGILAFREKFSGLAATRTAARLGSQARIAGSGGAASGAPLRSMVATRAAGSSGGINLAALSRDVGGGGEGGGIEGVQIARATSTLGGSGSSDRPRSDGPGLSRTDEEIQIVFDRHKAALYRLYNRELRRDPTLKGQMVLRLRIEPDGSVSLCELHGTDMRAPQLAAQVVERVRTFDFGAKEGIAAVTILYPIDFLPAT